MHDYKRSLQQIPYALVGILYKVYVLLQKEHGLFKQVCTLTRRALLKHTYKKNFYILSTFTKSTHKLSVALRSDLEWSKHMETMTNKVNSKLLFLHRNSEGLPREDATVWGPYQKYNSDKVERVQRRAARFVKSRCTYTLVFLIYLISWDDRLFLKGDRRLV